ncbi:MULTISPECIES: YhcH/YjgK/YiaL family protein [unclassified Prevotella]|uniref:YhcH/YjgK/YiaL family protein n=1 Tax=unclassified Prevotella TaxID=2638335 RepID=UPI00055D8280|nr:MULTISPECIES: YhcH/YjgK/YiaL family protein [unclassified Prevotella]SEV84212.1 YhcH/YjgK/YiaL family protein [Prevotella sp. khp7]
MIIDTLDNLNKYAALNPLFTDVIEFLNSHDIQTLEAGKYPIKDKDLFMNLQVAAGRSKEAAFLETHIEMIDIQIPISCAETFGYTPLCDLPDFEYNTEKDITKYGDTKPQTYVTVNPGQFAIFFPQDGHAPCITDEPEIRKAIFKVKA